MLKLLIAGFFVYGLISAVLVVWEFIYWWQKPSTLFLVINRYDDIDELVKRLSYLKERLPGKQNLKIICPQANEQVLTKLAYFFPTLAAEDALPELLKEKNYIIFL